MQVKPSSVIGAGRGLWATRQFEPGDFIGAYFGYKITLEQPIGNHNTNPDGIDCTYFFGLDDMHLIDAKPFGSSVMRTINHSFNPEKINCEFLCATDSNDVAKEIKVYATRAIAPGDEILADYSPEFAPGEPGSYWNNDMLEGVKWTQYFHAKLPKLAASDPKCRSPRPQFYSTAAYRAALHGVLAATEFLDVRFDDISPANRTHIAQELLKRCLSKQKRSKKVEHCPRDSNPQPQD